MGVIIGRYAEVYWGSNLDPIQTVIGLQEQSPKRALDIHLSLRSKRSTLKSRRIAGLNGPFTREWQHG